MVQNCVNEWTPKLLKKNIFKVLKLSRSKNLSFWMNQRITEINGIKLLKSSRLRYWNKYIKLIKESYSIVLLTYCIFRLLLVAKTFCHLISMQITKFALISNSNLVNITKSEKKFEIKKSFHQSSHFERTQNSEVRQFYISN